MEQRLTIITLGVKNLIISTKFYEEKFCWSKMKTSNEQISFFQLNGVLLSLFPVENLADDATIKSDGKGFHGFTMAYNTRSKKEVDELIANLEAKGVKIVKKPQKTSWGGYSSYIADPDYNLWEIAYNPYLQMDENGNTWNN